VATGIDLGDLQALLTRGAQLVEVLPENEYRQAHLPDAISLPLGRLKHENVTVLNRDRPVVVYCWDSL
jgi:rhodanese-related sulfurtransferase